MSFILHRNWPRPNSHRPPFDGSASEFGVFGQHWGRAEVAFDTLPAETGQFERRCPSYTAARRLALFTKCAFLKKYSLGSPQNRVPRLLGLVRIAHSSAPPPDDTEFGVKYRFIEQDKAGWVPSVGHLPVARGAPGRCGARSRYWQDPCFRAALGSKGLRRLDDLWRRRLLDQSRPRQQELLVRGLGATTQDY
jgi:hypothetical protein